jgi:hypothetical protein
VVDLDTAILATTFHLSLLAQLEDDRSGIFVATPSIRGHLSLRRLSAWPMRTIKAGRDQNP